MLIRLNLETVTQQRESASDVNTTRMVSIVSDVGKDFLAMRWRLKDQEIRQVVNHASVPRMGLILMIKHCFQYAMESRVIVAVKVMLLVEIAINVPMVILVFKFTT